MSDFQTTTAGARGGMKFKYILLVLLVAFACGGVATWWLASTYGALNAPAAINPNEPTNAIAQLPSGNVAPVLPPANDSAGPNAGQVSPVYVTDSVISSDAVRGEGLLLTYAVRRALDDGAPLGYLAEQLRLRFGASQPQAVATVVSAAQAPVTISMLQTELNGLGPVLLSGNREASVWARMQRELSQLFVLRRDGGNALAPTQRLVRAQVFVEAGMLLQAMEEVAALPGASAAQSWMVRAKRFGEARKALDRLEQTALIRPVMVPVAAPPPVQTPLPENSATAS
jgi:hypothetical protein